MQMRHPNRLRIIGGKWRGRVFSFPNAPMLRPTPNRVRETLFNWLSPVIVGSHCLDLFAGSGALGFEALSRGAASVTFIDHQSLVVDHLIKTAMLLQAEQAVSVVRLEIPSPHFVCEKRFDIVFLDPPFGGHLIEASCQWLETQHLLAENASIYIEAEKALKLLPVPKHWELVKSKVAGRVGYHLLKVRP